MKLGRTLVISFLFAVVVAVYIFQHRIDKEAMSIVPDEISRGVSLESGEVITRIEILDRVKKTETDLEFSNGGWTVTAPVIYPADKQAAGGFAATLRFATKLTRLRAERDWSEYGLERPKLEVGIETDKKKKAAEIIL